MNNIDYKAVVEILENFLKKEKTEILGISVGEEHQLRQAIENLIKENKELKKPKYFIDCKTNEIRILTNDFISKDKIKAKIEELEKDVNDFEEYWSKDPRRFKRQQSIDYYKLEALQELLEEGE